MRNFKRRWYKTIPIYEFECPIHGKFSGMFSLSEFELIKNGILCNIQVNRNPCGKIAEKLFSLTGIISIGKPTVIFRNPKTGETEVAASDYDTPGKGFIREELKNPIERSKFEREVQARQNIADEIVTETLKQNHSETRKNRHAEIESKMSSFPNDGTREFLRKAMNRKSKRKFPEKKTEVKLTINHTDSSNLIK